VISHVAAAKAKKSKADDAKDDTTTSKGHLVLHVKETTVKRAPPAAAAAAAVVASKSKKATVENGDVPSSAVVTSEATSEGVTVSRIISIVGYYWVYAHSTATLRYLLIVSLRCTALTLR
jgi:hypothetical protein